MKLENGRPRSNPVIQKYLDGATRSNFLWTFGGISHPWDVDDPRPNPQVTLSELKQRSNQYHLSWAPEFKDLVFYAFYSDKYRVTPEKAMTVNFEQIWWLVSPQDIVLLSDGTTSHYTFIQHVDRKSQRICFRDPWASRFFLLKGRNTVGISAQPGPAVNDISVSKPEFSKVVVGIMTVDTADLPENFFKRFPSYRTDKNINLGFAYSFLDLDRDRMLLYALPYLEAAILDDKKTGNRISELRLAALLFMVVHVGFCKYKTEDLRLKVDEIVLEYTLQSLQANLHSEELARIGHWLCHMGLLTSGIDYFDRAIDKNPHDEMAFLSRAKAHARLLHISQSLSDLDKALAENNNKIKEFTLELDKLHPHEKWNRPYFQDAICGYMKRRIMECEFKIALLQQSDDDVNDEIDRITREVEDLSGRLQEAGA